MFITFTVKCWHQKCIHVYQVTGTCWLSDLFLSGLGDLVLCDRLFMDSCRFRRKSFLASLTAACSWSSERTERCNEPLQLWAVSCRSWWVTSFSITIGPGGSTRVARFRTLVGQARLNKSCEKKGKMWWSCLLLKCNIFKIMEQDSLHQIILTYRHRCTQRWLYELTAPLHPLVCIQYTYNIGAMHKITKMLLYIVCLPCFTPLWPLLSRYDILIADYSQHSSDTDMIVCMVSAWVHQV